MYVDLWNQEKERHLLKVTLELRKMLLRNKQTSMAKDLDRYTSQYILLMRDGQEKVDRLNIEIDSLTAWIGKEI